MALATPETYDTLALAELEAASATDDLAEKKRRLNQASALATLAELVRERNNPPPDT
ncbi:MAG TPA: hypothetical protein VF637_07890 [Sphingomicrobium sp.]